MAFNFNWSPLTADADFYSRARDLLTTALNKSPKPPIIVDDILVEELNLGTVPPDLEILEIGDLAEDRFRGIFKMCYSGDAYLTLKTRVQANPLNTYLDSKPAFTSPKPLAAASGLTIPVTITLSDIKLSAFIILVFSKQKGLTLVFRNDPLESLKVSSTFDRIQFVRDYLQRTIEQQLRNLMMEELPAIIHRLSLQLWCPDQANKTDEPAQVDQSVDDTGIDPFLSPPEDPVDAFGNLLDPGTVSEMTLHGAGETQSLFSQKNLLRLAALTDSHRTLSLFTPGIRDVVFRAWTGHGDRPDAAAAPVAATPSLSRYSSVNGGASTTYTFSDTASASHGHLPSRPSLISVNSANSGLALGAGNRSRPGRKKKTRVVNLRNRSNSETQSEIAASEFTSDSASVAPSENPPLSEPMPTTSSFRSSGNRASISSMENNVGKVHFSSKTKRSSRHSLLSNVPLTPNDFEQSVPIMGIKETEGLAGEEATDKAANHRRNLPSYDEKGGPSSDTSSVIHEQAWINKMADEICRQLYDEKKLKGIPTGCSSCEDQDAPPAYEAHTH